MNGLGRAFFTTVLALTALMPAAAQDRIGELTYLEEGLAVTRDNRSLKAAEIDIGMDIHNLDLLKTDKTGFAEIAIEAPKAPSSVIKVSPNTTFYLELNSVGKEKKTTVGAITGTLSVKVQKLAANQQMGVTSESALMGVRGTTFEVTLSPSGDLLVSCSEGEVSCEDSEGNEVSAKPGTVVEQKAGELFRKIPVAVSDLESFRRDWYAERIEVFKANPLKAIRFYALRYGELRERFLKAYAALQKESRLIQKWYDEDRKGQIGAKMEMLKEKKQLIGHLVALRKILFLFERIYFRLAELEEYYRQGYGEGAIQGSLTSRAFFQSFARDRDELARKMADIRYLTKLYAKRNEGSFPTDRAEEDEQEFFEDMDF